jgi:hypothetical protein
MLENEVEEMGKEEEEHSVPHVHWISGEVGMTGHFTDCCVIYKPQHLHTNIQDTLGHSKHRVSTHTF